MQYLGPDAWACNVTVEEVRRVAEPVSSEIAQPADALAEDFLANLRDEFGRDLPAQPRDADVQYQALR